MHIWGSSAFAAPSAVIHRLFMLFRPLFVLFGMGRQDGAPT